MPIFGSKVQLSSAASSSGIALADANFIAGAFYTVQEYNMLANIPVGQVQNKQIVWVQDAEATYQATVTPPDFITTIEPSVSWSEFTGFAGGGGGFAGDITAVLAGDGLVGGGFSGNVTLNANPGPGITIASDAIKLDTGSGIFTQAVIDLSIFQVTGSFYSANANFQITGSLGLNFKNEEKFTIHSGSEQVFEIDNYGVITLATQSSVPQLREGGVYLDSNKNLFIGM
jgi:hypothetical protein